MMTEETFAAFKEFIEGNVGIRLPPAKKVMLEARLAKRVRALGFSTHEEYRDYVFGPEGFDREVQELIDAVTTNETSFFRESPHFDILAESVLPEFIRSGALEVNMWSVAASTGQEAFTLAMVAEEFARARGLAARYRVLATDISDKVLSIAKTAIYTESQAEKIPPALKRAYCLRSRDHRSRTIRMKPELRARVLFRKLNLMDQSYPVGKKYGVVFCRNVFIYFDRPTQRKILERLHACMEPGGFLFMGHSENITQANVPFKAIASAVYRRE